MVRRRLVCIASRRVLSAVLARFSRMRCFRPKLRLFPPKLQRWNNPTLRRVFYIVSRHSAYHKTCTTVKVSYVGAGEELQTRGRICGRVGEFVDARANLWTWGEVMVARESLWTRGRNSCHE